MKNYFVLNQDLTKIQAIDALATILQDESLQLTGEMEKVGFPPGSAAFSSEIMKTGTHMAITTRMDIILRIWNRSWIISKISIKAASWTIWIQNVTMVP